MGSLNVRFSRSRMRIAQLGPRRSKIAQSSLCLLTQRRRQCIDACKEILPFLFPAKLNDLVVFCIEHRCQIFWRIVIEIQPCFCIRAPSVLNFQEQISEQSYVCWVANRKSSFSDPALAQACDLAKSRKLERIARNTVDPRVSNFLCQHRKSVTVRFDGVRYFSKIGWSDTRIGVSRTKRGVCLVDFLDRVWAQIVVAYHHRDRQV